MKKIKKISKIKICCSYSANIHKIDKIPSKLFSFYEQKTLKILVRDTLVINTTYTVFCQARHKRQGRCHSEKLVKPSFLANRILSSQRPRYESYHTVIDQKYNIEYRILDMDGTSLLPIFFLFQSRFQVWFKKFVHKSCVIFLQNIWTFISHHERIKPLKAQFQNCGLSTEVIEEKSTTFQFFSSSIWCVI